MAGPYTGNFGHTAFTADPTRARVAGWQRGAAVRGAEDRRVERLQVLGLGEDEPTGGPAQRLVRGGRDDIGDVNGRRIQAGGDEPGIVRHVHHEARARLVGDVAEFLPVD